MSSPLVLFRYPPQTAPGSFDGFAVPVDVVPDALEEIAGEFELASDLDQGRGCLGLRRHCWFSGVKSNGERGARIHRNPTSVRSMPTC